MLVPPLTSGPPVIVTVKSAVAPASTVSGPLIKTLTFGLGEAPWQKHPSPPSRFVLPVIPLEFA